MLRDQAIVVTALVLPSMLLLSVAWSVVTEHFSRAHPPTEVQFYRMERQDESASVQETPERVAIPA